MPQTWKWRSICSCEKSWSVDKKNWELNQVTSIIIFRLEEFSYIMKSLGFRVSLEIFICMSRFHIIKLPLFLEAYKHFNFFNSNHAFLWKNSSSFQNEQYCVLWIGLKWMKFKWKEEEEFSKSTHLNFLKNSIDRLSEK